MPTNLNPIQSVNGVAIACPSTYDYSLSDISAADSGRTEDTVMHKNKIGQCVTLGLAWRNISTATASAILQAFDPEYITVRFFDLKSGTYKPSVFYVGDRSAPMYNAKLGLWSGVSFNIIERSGA